MRRGSKLYILWALDLLPTEVIRWMIFPFLVDHEKIYAKYSDVNDIITLAIKENYKDMIEELIEHDRTCIWTGHFYSAIDHDRLAIAEIIQDNCRTIHPVPPKYFKYKLVRSFQNSVEWLYNQFEDNRYHDQIELLMYEALRNNDINVMDFALRYINIMYLIGNLEYIFKGACKNNRYDIAKLLASKIPNAYVQRDKDGNVCGYGAIRVIDY